MQQHASYIKYKSFVGLFWPNLALTELAGHMAISLQTLLNEESLDREEAKQFYYESIP